MNSWVLGSEHPIYGRVVAMACIEGEPYRFFQDAPNSISMIPLDVLNRMGVESC